MLKLLSLALLLISWSAVAVEVPVDDLAAWTILSFNDIPPNEVSVSDEAMLIRVNGSASPLIFKLDRPAQITGITVMASWAGELRIPEGAIQGGENADDFLLKFGIVESGEQTLGWIKRRIAADWIKQLFSLAPRGSGVSRINFLSTTRQQELLGSSRTHPLSDLMHETRIVYLDGAGDFQMEQQFPAPVEVLGLWISADGDDTGSAFDLRINRITLHAQP